MIIGVDFDNTIVDHDALFFDVALEMGLVSKTVEKSKNAVREHILRAYSNEEWTVLQSEVYGARLLEAPCYPGVMEFFRQCRTRGVPAYIVSHKTHFPGRGKPYDLHRSAFAWLESQGFFSTAGIQLNREHVYFAETRVEKLQQIAQLRCTHFVDDLPEVFAEPGFPGTVHKILFDPSDTHISWHDGVRARSWAEIQQLV